MNKETRFIFVTGGVISGIGKGITAASLGRLLVSHNYSVFSIKTDPYLNEDAGTMNPFQHGEVFVTDDGAETDLDLGHYERFISRPLDKRSNFTSGSVYREVLDKERRGEFLGRTIQVVPHITDEIKSRIYKAAEEEKPDFLLVEIGGTVGSDMEIAPFLEAMRQIMTEVGRERSLSIHVVKIDYVFPSDEEKTKPIQNSVRQMMGLGLMPDVLVVRAKREVAPENIEKISMFCNVPTERIIEAVDAGNIYEIPVNLEERGLLNAVLKRFSLDQVPNNLLEWRKKVDRIKNVHETVRIGMVGKYHNHPDAYISVKEALFHGGVENDVKVEIVPIDSESNDLEEQIKDVRGIIVPGGYGKRGVEGMIEGIRIARENKIPFLGLCYGLQMAVIERARNVLGWEDADTTENSDNTKHPVIDILENQKGLDKMGGNQRLGAYKAVISPDTVVSEIYGIKNGGEISERHRHRYEVNPAYHTDLENSGLILSGKSPDGELVEFIEIPRRQHPFFVATQAHPELKSKFMEPHPIFVSFISAVKDNK